MKRQAFLLIFLILSVALANAQIEQDTEVGARGSFLSTRPLIEKKVNSSSVEKPTTKKPNVSQKKTIKNKSTLGLGYSIYLKGKNDEALRVSSAKEFQEGDAIRLVIEPNIDGYLYIFHTENDEQPTMIFPDTRLKQGDNTVQAHVPYQIPSSSNPDPSLQWFVFDEKSATEKLYLILSRTPLDKVPSSEDLMRYCKEKLCPWRPNETLWQELKSSSSPAKVSKTNSDQGEVQSSIEKQSIKETIALGKKASAPSVIYMQSLQASDKLVSVVSLVHK